MQLEIVISASCYDQSIVAWRWVKRNKGRYIDSGFMLCIHSSAEHCAMHKQYYELTVNGDYSAEGKRSTGLTWLNEV